MPKKSHNVKELVKDYFTEPQAPPPEKIEKPSRRYDRATFYLDADIIKRLEHVWLEGRRKDRHVTKSGLVEKWIKEGLDRIEK